MSLPEMPKLPMEEIEFRAEGKPFERNNGHQCLWVAYLKAPTVAAKFDEWVGPENWTDSYEIREMRPKGTDVVQAIECTIRVYDDMNERWVSKSDIGEFTNWSAVKGGWSDSFKRCASLKWGVGRVVYELPQVWASCRTYGQGQNVKIGGETKTTKGEIEKQLKAKGFTGAPHVGSAEPEEDSAPVAAPSAPAAPVGAPVAPEGSHDVMEAFNALGPGKSTAMHELKEAGLWPPPSLSGKSALDAMAIIERVGAAVEVAS